MKNAYKLLEANDKRTICKMKKASCEFICLDKEFGAKQILDVIAFVNGVHHKYKRVNMPIYFHFSRVEIIDKLSYVIMECICYMLIKDYHHAVSISWAPKNNILTQGVFSSPLAILNTDIARAPKKYLDKFEYEIFRYHYRKVITEDKKETNYLGKLQQDIYNFLSTFYIEEDCKDDIVEMIGEIVGNAGEHAKSQCLLDIDVTTDHSKSVESVVQNGNYYGINIVILNFSDILFGDGVKNRIENDDLNSDQRYIFLKQAYTFHSEHFSEQYTYEDFCNIASIQHKISGATHKGKAGGRGLTTLIKSLQEKSDSDNCYLLSVKRIVYFQKELLQYDDAEWLGFNKEKDFLSNIPDSIVAQECIVNFPGTAYNLNFILKREDGISNESYST